MPWLARLVHELLGIYSLGLVVFAMLSWIRTPETAKISTFLGRFYEPLLTPIRRAVPTVNLGGSQVDLSVLVLLLAIYVVRGLVTAILVF